MPKCGAWLQHCQVFLHSKGADIRLRLELSYLNNADEDLTIAYPLPYLNDAVLVGFEMRTGNELERKELKESDAEELEAHGPLGIDASSPMHPVARLGILKAKQKASIHAEYIVGVIPKNGRYHWSLSSTAIPQSLSHEASETRCNRFELQALLPNDSSIPTQVRESDSTALISEANDALTISASPLLKGFSLHWQGSESSIHPTLTQHRALLQLQAEYTSAQGSNSPVTRNQKRQEIMFFAMEHKLLSHMTGAVTVFLHPTDTSIRLITLPILPPLPSLESWQREWSKTKDRAPTATNDRTTENTNAPIKRQNQRILGKGIVSYYEQMNPGTPFPLLLAVQMQAGEEFETRSLRVKLIPVLPGCHVTPSELTVNVKSEQIETRFWVTPLITGDLSKSATIQLWHRDELQDEIALPLTIRKQTTTKLLALSAVLLMALKAYTTSTGWADSAKRLPQSIGKLQTTGELLSHHLVAVMTSVLSRIDQLGFALIGATIIVAWSSYAMHRPKTSTPLTSTLQMRTQRDSPGESGLQRRGET